MVNLLEAVFLGIVQGLTEWLPISSSGHLVIVQQLLHIEVPLLFDVMLHFGTLIAVFALLWKDIIKILKSLIGLDFQSPSGRLITFIIIGSIPIVLIGYFLHDFVESLFTNLFAVGVALFITGIFLFLTKYTDSNRDLEKNDSLLIGLAQAAALIPGISRSGATISTGLFKGIDKELIFKFSFLLSIPAVLGANIFELNNAILNGITLDIQMVIGTVIAAIIGYLSLKFLFNTLQKGKFYLFCYYCWVIGIASIIFSMFL